MRVHNKYSDVRGQTPAAEDKEDKLQQSYAVFLLLVQNIAGYERSIL
jgi:hypothetical protein